MPVLWLGPLQQENGRVNFFPQIEDKSFGNCKVVHRLGLGFVNGESIAPTSVSENRNLLRSNKMG